MPVVVPRMLLLLLVKERFLPFLNIGSVVVLVDPTGVKRSIATTSDCRWLSNGYRVVRRVYIFTRRLSVVYSCCIICFDAACGRSEVRARPCSIYQVQYGKWLLGYITYYDPYVQFWYFHARVTSLISRNQTITNLA